MATKYLLGQKAARFLHDAMNESPVGRRLQAGKVTAALEFAAPWTLRYSASVYISGSGSSVVRGGWIIWLPEGSWVGASVDTDVESEEYMRPLTPEDDQMPEGWYLLTSAMSNYLSQNGENPLYATVEGGLIRLTNIAGGVRIADSVCDAQKKTKNVRQIVRSAINVTIPWNFSCVENPTTHVRTGGWTNCILQFGYNYVLRSGDVSHIQDSIFAGGISGTNLTADGEYWVEINVASRTAVIKTRGSAWQVVNPNDLANNIIRIRIGEVENGKLKYGLHHNPVIYTYI